MACLHHFHGPQCYRHCSTNKQEHPQEKEEMEDPAFVLYKYVYVCCNPEYIEHVFTTLHSIEILQKKYKAYHIRLLYEEFQITNNDGSAVHTKLVQNAILHYMKTLAQHLMIEADNVISDNSLFIAESTNFISACNECKIDFNSYI